MIRRHKTTIFTDAKESSTVFELKRIVEGILKRPPDEQRLYKDDQLLDDGKTLGECGFTSQTARPQAPATVGLAFRAGEAWETGFGSGGGSHLRNTRGPPCCCSPQKPTCHPSCSVFLVLSSFSPRPAPRPPGVHQESTKAILVSRHPVPAWGYSSSLSLLVPWLPQKPAPGALSGGREEGAWAPGSPS
uniref:Elongin-B n=1 Tax=Capra hircus TaxID=9925 RepID=A0A8C2PBA5_CAPHI